MIWSWNYLWYIAGGFALIIFSWFMLVKKRKSNKLICSHKFIPNGFLNVKDKVRLVLVCKKCGQFMHSAVPSKKQLKKREDILYERYFKDR